MGKLILISGPNGSGKSRFAEGIIEKYQGKRYYIATMVSRTEDNERRIRKHREQREKLNFTTLEIPFQVGKADITAGSAVLLEDVSNLLANTIFDYNGNDGDVYHSICALAERSRLLIAVTISGLCPDGYEGETAAYINELNRLNQRMFERADAAAEIRDGIPNWKKGDIDGIMEAGIGIPGGGPVHIQRDSHAAI